MIITLFILFILYTIACCMDGDDLKPRWKWWLGKRLEGYAKKFKPIDYCIHERCRYYSRPTIMVSDFDVVPVKSRVVLKEEELFEAKMYKSIISRHGVPEWQMPCCTDVPLVVERAKERCVGKLLDEVRPFVKVEVGEDSRIPGIAVTATLRVGRPRMT